MDASLNQFSRSPRTSVTQGSNSFSGDVNALNSQVFQGNFDGCVIMKYKSEDPKATVTPNYSGHYSSSSLRTAASYVERPELLNTLRARFSEAPNGRPDRDTEVVVLHGLGGAGKTQLILRYLQECRHEYDATFWIEASRSDTIEADFRNIYRLLYDKLDAELQVNADIVVTAVKSWFASRTGRWVFIFDSADAIDHDEGERWVDIMKYMPSSSNVRTIITSRNPAARHMDQEGGIEVGNMEASEAADLLRKCAGMVSNQHQAEVDQIVETLGQLPLAISLAGYFISETHTSLSEYLDMYGKQRSLVLSQRPEKYIHAYTESVLTTWETSFEMVQKREPIAAILLSLLSFFSNEDIYLGLFQDLVNEDGSVHIIHHSESSSGGKLDEAGIKRSLQVLGRYSFVRYSDELKSYSLHKLVHTWGYDRLTLEEKKWFSCIALRLITLKSTEAHDLRARLRIMPHGVANLSTIYEAYKKPEKENIRILEDVWFINSLFRYLGRWAELRTSLEFLILGLQRIWGDDHVDTIRAISNLAHTLEELGHNEDAARIWKEVVERSKRTLGEDHRITITASNNRAYSLAELGYCAEATSMLKELLEKQSRIFSIDNLDTLPTKAFLASVLYMQGYDEEAERMQKEVLEELRLIFGEDHPDTILSMATLAVILARQGHLEDAVNLNKAALTQAKEVLGEEHPSTRHISRNQIMFEADAKRLQDSE